MNNYFNHRLWIRENNVVIKVVTEFNNGEKDNDCFNQKDFSLYFSDGNFLYSAKKGNMKRRKLNEIKNVHIFSNDELIMIIDPFQPEEILCRTLLPFMKQYNNYYDREKQYISLIICAA